MDHIYPKLTPNQISHISERGYTRQVHLVEVLVEQGDDTEPFFVIFSGEVEVVYPSGAVETLVTMHGSGEFTGEVNMLSRRRSFVRIRVTKAGKVVQLNRQNMMSLLQNDT